MYANTIYLHDNVPHVTYTYKTTDLAETFD